jgi:FkbM family methyltransferase
MSVFATQLEELLAETVEAACQRESAFYDERTKGAGREVVLFGAGSLGRSILRGLRTVGIEPVAFSDNNPGSWGQQVDGLTVLAPEEAARRYGARGVFVVTIFSPGADRLFPGVRRKLETLGCSFVVPFGALAWKYPTHFLPNYCLDLPHKVLADARNVRKAFALWGDDQSRKEFVDQLRWRLRLDYDGLGDPFTGVTYFPDDLIAPREGEFLVDCGAFDGDTIQTFLGLRGDGFRRVVAFEPDPNNWEKLSYSVSSLPEPVRSKIELHRAGVASKRQKLHFEATGNMAAKISDAGQIVIDTVPLDEVLEGRAPTYVKMDIEAAEPDALAGATRTIRQFAPVLAICVYHRQDHLWRIPLQISELSDQYAFYLRRYQEEVWEVVCYAVPRSRQKILS